MLVVLVGLVVLVVVVVLVVFVVLGSGAVVDVGVAGGDVGAPDSLGPVARPADSVVDAPHAASPSGSAAVITRAVIRHIACSCRGTGRRPGPMTA